MNCYWVNLPPLERPEQPRELIARSAKAKRIVGTWLQETYPDLYRDLAEIAKAFGGSEAVIVAWDAELYRRLEETKWVT